MNSFFSFILRQSIMVAFCFDNLSVTQQYIFYFFVMFINCLCNFFYFILITDKSIIVEYNFYIFQGRYQKNCKLQKKYEFQKCKSRAILYLHVKNFVKLILFLILNVKCCKYFNYWISLCILIHVIV